jgi:hypothetical protein
MPILLARRVAIPQNLRQLLRYIFAAPSRSSTPPNIAQLATKVSQLPSPNTYESSKQAQLRQHVQRQRDHDPVDRLATPRRAAVARPGFLRVRGGAGGARARGGLRGGRAVRRAASAPGRGPAGELLRQAEEEYGFPTGASGHVALPCDEDRLRDVVRRVSSTSIERRSIRRRRGDSRPLLQGVNMRSSFRDESRQW